jgi:hypothetical protein
MYKNRISVYNICIYTGIKNEKREKEEEIDRKKATVHERYGFAKKSENICTKSDF